MGHDILGFNKAGEEIAYARFSMGNYNATILYRLLNAEKYYAGVSGSGGSTTLSVQHVQKALNDYNDFFADTKPLSEREILYWDKKQIGEFLINCLETAQNDGSVEVYFG
ncbi:MULTISPECIES: hypothetical protein [Bacillaceae]|uniref:Uncharacterized protein n=1 Tax=Evansella alkalicola TaxID=745819 RepID=A0ABS6JYM3_9BACI|nr:MULTISPECIES: hypothetical protein [Bacillaceae]MBU9723490.1 hypothetical protein [Bacillus alkalicola]